MKRISLLLILSFVFLSQAFAQVDPFNTYRWNRKNVLNHTGRTDTRPWFEWWYYKVVIPETNKSFYFVYGVVNPWDHKKTLKGTRAYIGMGDFDEKISTWEFLPLSAFNAKYNETYVDVAGNVATDKNLKGDFTDEQGRRFSWNIEIDKRWAYNATGWATGTGITNIEWYPAQADARCSGSVTSQGKQYNFQNAPCYQDRNWGVEFPKWWAWIVSNKFENHPDTTLAIGGGFPKIAGTEIIQGVSIGLRHKGKEYAFRPNHFDTVTMQINWGKWETEAISRNGLYRIQVSAWAPKEKFMDLQFMTPTGELYHDYETLIGNVKVKLYQNVGSVLFPKWKTIADLNSNYAGIEYGSPQEYGLEKFFADKKVLFTNKK